MTSNKAKTAQLIFTFALIFLVAFIFAYFLIKSFSSDILKENSLSVIQEPQEISLPEFYERDDLAFASETVEETIEPFKGVNPEDLADNASQLDPVSFRYDKKSYLAEYMGSEEENTTLKFGSLPLILPGKVCQPDKDYHEGELLVFELFKFDQEVSDKEHTHKCVKLVQAQVLETNKTKDFWKIQLKNKAYQTILSLKTDSKINFVEGNHLVQTKEVQNLSKKIRKGQNVWLDLTSLGKQRHETDSLVKDSILYNDQILDNQLKIIDKIDIETIFVSE